MEHSKNLSIRSRISHELRTPLSAIIVLVDLLKSTNLNAEQKSYIDDIEISAHQLLQIEDLIFSWVDDSHS